MFGKAKVAAGSAATVAGSAATMAGGAAIKAGSAAAQGAKKASQLTKSAATTGYAMSKEVYASLSSLSVYRKTAFFNSFTQIIGIMACTFVVLFPKSSGQLTGMDEQGHVFDVPLENISCQMQEPDASGNLGTIAPDLIYKDQLKLLNVQGPCTMITLLLSLLFTNIWMATGADANVTGKIVQGIQMLLAIAGIGCTSSAIDMIWKMKKNHKVSKKCWAHFQMHLRFFMGMCLIFVVQFVIGFSMVGFSKTPTEQTKPVQIKPAQTKAVQNAASA